MFEVEIKLGFRYAHRLLDYVGKCSYLHGEYGTAIFFFKGDALDKAGLLIDFGVAKRMLKDWIDGYLDHATILNKKDELFPLLVGAKQRVYTMSGNPSAENLAKLLFGVAKNMDLPVVRVGIVESKEDSIAWYDEQTV